MPNLKVVDTHVFLNCPFDAQYKPIFEAILFTVHKCGFKLRSALEDMDSSKIRLTKILELIGTSKYSIHDLSRVGLSGTDDPLPRFNMPLELGCAIGCKGFGSRAQSQTEYLVLVSKPYQYQKFISDMAGCDPVAHMDKPAGAVKAVRDWLSTKVHPRPVPAAKVIMDDLKAFMQALPELCKRLSWDENDLTFLELQSAIDIWCRAGDQGAGNS